MGLRESLEVLLLAPRELGPLSRVRGLWQIDALLFGHSLLRFPPLEIWLEGRGQPRPFGDFRFGETPWFTGRAILEEAGVGPDDRFFDLGCGRGKMVFLARLLCGCTATGVELLPGYVWVARRLVRWLQLTRTQFLQKDFAEVDLGEATVVFVAGSIFSADARADLALLIDDLSPGCQWISVTWPWEHPALALESEHERLFSWGREQVYRYRVR